MAQQLFKIPLANVPQQFAITLSGVQLQIICRWNAQSEVWELEMIDAVANSSLIAGLPLVTGCDLLSQYQHLGLGGQLIVSTDGDDLQSPPSLENLGADANLYYLTGTA